MIFNETTLNRLLIVPHFSNLVYDVDERQLGEVFGMFGQVRDVKIPKKGHAIIEYRESSEALRALIILRNQLLEGRKLMIKMDGAPFAKSTDNSRGNFERGPPPPTQQYWIIRFCSLWIPSNPVIIVSIGTIACG